MSKTPRQLWEDSVLRSKSCQMEGVYFFDKEIEDMWNAFLTHEPKESEALALLRQQRDEAERQVMVLKEIIRTLQEERANGQETRPETAHARVLQ